MQPADKPGNPKGDKNLGLSHSAIDLICNFLVLAVVRRYNTKVRRGKITVMGITYIRGQVKGAKGKQASVKFLIDSGATYSVLPKRIWQAIGLKPKRQMTFTLADGTIIDRQVSEAHIRLPQGEAHTPVILGEENDQALLGVVTLEILGLVFNPFDRTLQPMRMLLCFHGI